MFDFDIILKNEYNLVDNKSLYHGFFNSIIKIVFVLIITSVFFAISFSYLIHHYQLATTTVEYVVILRLSTLLWICNLCNKLCCKNLKSHLNGDFLF